jgi:hypothetical protein
MSCPSHGTAVSLVGLSRWCLWCGCEVIWQPPYPYFNRTKKTRISRTRREPGDGFGLAGLWQK